MQLLLGSKALYVNALKKKKKSITDQDGMIIDSIVHTPALALFGPVQNAPLIGLFLSHWSLLCFLLCARNVH